MRRGRGAAAPAPKRPLATTAHAPLRRHPVAAPPSRHPPSSSSSAAPRRHPTHSAHAPPSNKGAGGGGCKAPPAAGAQHHGINVHGKPAAPSSISGKSHADAPAESTVACNRLYASNRVGKPAVKSVTQGSHLSASDHRCHPPSAPSLPQQTYNGPAQGKTVNAPRALGIPRLTPVKRPPDRCCSPSLSTYAVSRVREWAANSSNLTPHGAPSSNVVSSSTKRPESPGVIADEEDKRRKVKRAALLSRRSPLQHRDRTSSASSPAVLTSCRTPSVVASSANVTRRNTEGPHRRRRELPEVACGEVPATQRQEEDEWIELELTPQGNQRGPSKSGIHRGEVGRGRNGSGGAAGAGARAEAPPAPSGGVAGSTTDREVNEISSSTEQLQQNHRNHHIQQQPPRQLGRRKLAAAASAVLPPPRVQRDPSPVDAAEAERIGKEVMVGREEEEEGGRVETRPRMDVVSSRKREEEEEVLVVEEDHEVDERREGMGGVKIGGSDGGGKTPSSLEKQIVALGLEKCELEAKLEEVLQGAKASKEEVDHLRDEVAVLKCQKNADVNALEEENRVLRERLRELTTAGDKDGGGQRTEEDPGDGCSLRPQDVASALSDSEKEQLLLSRSPSGRALSINSGEEMGVSGRNSGDVSGGDTGVSNVVSSDNTLCPTPEWDKQSSSSLSEVSVACLQDRILQMEETHYSTNEELQATLQELADLQAQLTELQSENERLSEEKSVLLESLCRQTEKLEDTRSRADTLEELLLGTPQSSSLPSEALDECGESVGESALPNGAGEGADLGECSDREQKLVDLLKNAQEERENLLSRLEDLKVQLEEAREAWSSRGEESDRLQDRVRLLESALEAANAERRELDKELGATKEESSARQIQISRLSTLLDNARAKIEELEQAREVRDKCELDNLLDNARKEKDALEGQVASLQEKLSHSQCEVSRLKDSVCSLQEECKVARNNAKSALSDLEYQLEQGRSEMALLAEEVRRQTEEAAGACAQSQRHLEDKRTLKAALSEAQRATLDAERRLNDLKNELEEEKKIRKEENEEWERFQSDLLVTVRVANDFKNEAKLELEKYVLENRGLKDKIKVLEAEMEKLKASPRSSSPAPSNNSTSSALSVQSDRRGLALRTVSAPPTGGAGGSEGANVGAILSSVMQQQQEAMALAVRRQKPGGISRADSRLSVKSLIESIENATKQVKAGPGGGSRSSSTSSLSSITSADPRGNISLALTAANSGANINQSPTIPTDSSDSADVFTVGNGSIKAPLRDQQQNNNQVASLRSQRKAISVSDGMYSKPSLHDTLKGSTGSVSCSKNNDESIPLNTVSILSNKMDFVRRNSYGDLTAAERKDPLSALVRNGGSRRNALLKWCQNKTVGYRNIDITNFSSSWNDGLAFCALLHTYLPDRIPYDSLLPSEKRKNFSLAFSAAESVGIPTSLNINEMIQLERPDWQQVMSYVTSIYKHFET